MGRSKPEHAVGGPRPLWELGDAAREIWNRVRGSVVLTDHRAMILFGRYCQLLATWQRTMATIEKQGVAQAIKGGDGKGVREVKMLPHAEYVLRVEALLARVEGELEWKAA